MTAIAVYLRRPLKQLPTLRPGDTTVPATPDYLLLPLGLFEDLAARWWLERVDEVRVHLTGYVLARRIRG